MFAEFEPAKPGAEHDHVELFVVRHGHNVNEPREKSIGSKGVDRTRMIPAQAEGHECREATLDISQP
jgi:hypothetical protein